MREKVLKTGELEMQYGLNDRLPMRELTLYSIQHLIYFVANMAIIPVIFGSYLGLDPGGMATLIQRTFLICGIISVLQVYFGHRLPIIEGPAGLWMGVLIIMTSSAEALGKPLSVLRTDIQTGMIIAGVICAVLGVSGLMPKIAKLFTPVVNGLFLMLMVLQLSGSIAKGMLGVSSTNTDISWKSVSCFFLTVAIIVFFNIKTKGFIRSIATLLGVVIGWIAAAALGISPQIQAFSESFFTLPSFFVWGHPTVDVGIILTSILMSIILFSNMMASITGMCVVTGTQLTPKILNRGTLFYGIASIFAGFGSTIGYISYASSIGTVVMTRVSARKPFALGGACMIILGLIAPIGAFFAAIPPAVGYSALLVIFSMMIGQSLTEFSKTGLGLRESMIIGISLLLGIGIMSLPASTFLSLPQVLRYILSNGLVDGIIIAILLEHVLLRKTIQAK